MSTIKKLILGPKKELEAWEKTGEDDVDLARSDGTGICGFCEHTSSFLLSWLEEQPQHCQVRDTHASMFILYSRRSRPRQSDTSEPPDTALLHIRIVARVGCMHDVFKRT